MNNSFEEDVQQVLNAGDISAAAFFFTIFQTKQERIDAGFQKLNINDFFGNFRDYIYAIAGHTRAGGMQNTNNAAIHPVHAEHYHAIIIRRNSNTVSTQGNSLADFIRINRNRVHCSAIYSDFKNAILYLKKQSDEYTERGFFEFYHTVVPWCNVMQQVTGRNMYFNYTNVVSFAWVKQGCPPYLFGLPNRVYNGSLFMTYINLFWIFWKVQIINSSPLRYAYAHTEHINNAVQIIGGTNDEHVLNRVIRSLKVFTNASPYVLNYHMDNDRNLNNPSRFSLPDYMGEPGIYINIIDYPDHTHSMLDDRQRLQRSKLVTLLKKIYTRNDYFFNVEILGINIEGLEENYLLDQLETDIRQ